MEDEFPALLEDSENGSECFPTNEQPEVIKYGQLLISVALIIGVVILVKFLLHVECVGLVELHTCLTNTYFRPALHIEVCTIRTPN